MVFTGEAAWRWRMMLPASDRSYDTFWCQSVRWLALTAADPVTLTPPASASPGDDIRWRVSARDADFEPLSGAAVDVRVTGPDGKRRIARRHCGCGGARRLVRRAPAAARRRRLSRDRRGPAGRQGSGVRDGVGAGRRGRHRDGRSAPQRSGAAAHRGGVGRARHRDWRHRGLPGQLRAAVPAAVIVARRDLWHNGWSFAALVLLLAAEWLLRRQWGMR